jgi:hypothetical protein
MAPALPCPQKYLSLVILDHHIDSVEFQLGFCGFDKLCDWEVMFITHFGVLFTDSQTIEQHKQDSLSALLHWREFTEGHVNTNF